MALAGGLPLATSVATHKLADSESLEVMVACYNEICGQGVFFFLYLQASTVSRNEKLHCKPHAFQWKQCLDNSCMS